MDSTQINFFLASKSEYLPAESIPMLRAKLEAMSESQFDTLLAVPLKSPTTALILSIFLGCYGIDRFFIGDTGMGVGKLLTCGGLGIWAIVDWFMISDDTRKKNLEKLMQFC